MQSTIVATMPEKRVRQEKNKKYANDGSLESVDGLLQKLAIKCFARVEAMGLSMTFLDVRQEMNMSYVRARATWNPEGGARFSTYCQTACLNNFNARIEKMENERANLGMVSYHEVVTDRAGNGEEVDPLELMGGNECEDSHEERLIRIEEMRERLAGLSAGARRLITALLMSERDASSDAPPKLRELAAGVGLGGDELKEVKREILAKFGVRWL